MLKNKQTNLKWKRTKILILFATLAIISGCGVFGGDKASNKEGEEKVSTLPLEVTRYDGEKSKTIDSIYTANKVLALTFNGMGDESMVKQLLDELDLYGIKATFFLPGMRVAEEPELAKEILSRGHEIENNTLNRLDMNELSYEEIYKEIQLSNEVIKRETGVTPRYLRTKSGEYNDDVRLVTAQLGMDAVISYNINPKDGDMKDAKAIGKYVEKYIKRGGIVSLNTDINPEVVKSIAYISKAAEDINYKFIPLSKLIEQEIEKKPFNEIEGYDAVKINEDYENSVSEVYRKAKTDKKVVSLTFDDWASDKTITNVLDILAKYDIKATFFLIGNGVEKNPNLARAILEEGHEVASHSYNHKVVTEMTPEDLQEDLKKAHEVLTEAIQQKPTMLFRPATGSVDEPTAKVIAAAGYPEVALYDVTAFDWDVNNSAEDIVQSVMDKTTTGSVILLHILDDKHTIEALPIIIENLKGKGYEFIKMTELMNM
ncbi:polysaccharide deacetylase family protein [Psychrobacillus sp.]|uniref:polysaccharide deacetylase family protein n=1 Tax=Psychrobacillus sp. TaxID=1871623 RepID=UPI0028BEA3E4|nr:polysaccharide deacetylase family protein [Psychrobacillus sp.]